MLISIIIPTKNRNEILIESLENAVNSIQGFDAEIIVVNDGVALSNVPINLNVTVLENAESGVSSARNKGANAAKGLVLFFIDDDMNITTESIEIILQIYKQNLLKNSYFNFNWIYPNRLLKTLKFKKIGRYLLYSNYHTLEGRMHKKINYSQLIDDANGVASCAFCISKENFIKINGYDEKILFQGEDIDIAKRLQQNKISSKVITQVTCYHNQKDRLEIDEYLDRIYRGYLSQAKAGMLNKLSLRQQFVALFIPFFSVLKFIYTTIPNRPFFDKVSFRCIGLLSSITSIKAINVVKRNKLK